MNIVKFVKNKETISMVKEAGKVIGKEIKNTLIIGGLTRGAFALKNVGFKKDKKQKRRTKTDTILIKIDVDEFGKKMLKEAGKTLAIGAATRAGAEVLKVSKGLIKNSNENVAMNVRKTRTFIEEYREND